MNRSYNDSTIAAISTPPGAGGIGIIRISGPASLTILRSLFTPKDKKCSYQSHRLYYGHLRDPQSGRIVDEVLTVYMAAPATYTREDVVELHCHGSHLVLGNVLELVLHAGADLADPGEFTKRAFLNGRIDLTQAEAVIDILAAKTRKGVDLAQEQLSGSLYHRIDPVRQSLARGRAVVEVAIDFPDEDVEIADHSQLIRQLEDEVVAPLEELLAGAGRGRLYREGISMVIAGLPNVGKSSLLNTLLQEERALVTPFPGTTRDSIEELIDIEGVPVKIVDTAGIRSGAEEVEELGILRARELINRADLVLFLVDGTAGLSEADRTLYREVCHKPVIAVVNKVDLCGGREFDLAQLDGLKSQVVISAKEQIGIAGLKKEIYHQVVAGNEQWEEQGCAPNFRHKVALRAALEAARRVMITLEQGLTYDLIAVDLQECLDCLSEIVGETTAEDVLDVIFQQFCLGK
ncbi:tRNA uridine-5-carboxymethylaminomethyl(34) synthesis GTPase MnmE [Desulforhopalus singaporensis]|uniref:tRNA modification GTPase MnmE n=1 Tax=Desulforhopalus singaporensis TaxID=91360 RepID=A0A1H0JML2_9BACT|nr:tRNA uridine-5-carboxymethylaminomethyl(34) synthesis GTPase MnmE [Desulforhopalus singaporensis]SDO44956.1 tRNA modification GTPase trmE [Desulforhopalus singaporensis]